MLSLVMVIQRRAGSPWGPLPSEGPEASPVESAAGGEGHAAYYGRVGPRRVRKSVALRFLVR